MTSDGGTGRMQGFGVVAALCSLLLLLPLVVAAEPGMTALHADMERALQEEGMAGAVWATVDGDGAIRTGAAGAKNVITGEAMAPDSKVHVGSIAKLMISTGMLQLASAGRVDLDAPVERYLPALVFDNRWPAAPVRVRHLLDHTAGLDDMRLWQLFSATVTPDSALLEVFSRDPSVLAIRTRPGSRYSYSNMG